MNHQHNPIGFGVTLLKLLPAVAAAQAPLSIPIKADGSSDLPPRAELIRNEIRTVAGTGRSDDGGDGGPAAEAQLAYPLGLALGADVNLYIADAGNRRVRRVDASIGTITTVAGSGVEGFAGGSGEALKAQFRLPWDVAADAVGMVYVTDVNQVRVGGPGVLISAPLGASGNSITFEVSPDGLLFTGGSPLTEGLGASFTATPDSAALTALTVLAGATEDGATGCRSRQAPKTRHLSCT